MSVSDGGLSPIPAFLQEDIGEGDITTNSLVPSGMRGEASVVSRQPLVLAGTELAAAVFRQLDPRLEAELHHHDGDRVDSCRNILTIRGSIGSILTAERVALNCLGRLSGIATLTARYVAAVEGLPCRILDTRKTTPGWRRLEKMAVRCGGGHNHRMDLGEAALVKDNHLQALRGTPAQRVTTAVERIRRCFPGKPIEVEADTLDQVRAAVEAGAGRVLLDNMGTELLGRAVRLVDGRIRTEASGGVTLDNVREVAATGVDFVSVGALTHSSPVADFSLELP